MSLIVAPSVPRIRPVTYDQTFTAPPKTQSSATWTHTVSPGANFILTSAFGAGGATSWTVTYNGVTIPELGADSSNGGFMLMWGGFVPISNTPQNYTVVLTFNNLEYSCMGSVSYFGVGSLGTFVDSPKSTTAQEYLTMSATQPGGVSTALFSSGGQDNMTNNTPLQSSTRWAAPYGVSNNPAALYLDAPGPFTFYCSGTSEWAAIGVPLNPVAAYPV